MMCVQDYETKAWGSWHVGEDVYLPEGPVQTFSFDGDELNWLLQAWYRDGYKVHSGKKLTPVY